MSSHSAELHAWRFVVAERWISAAISIDTHATLEHQRRRAVYSDGSALIMRSRRNVAGHAASEVSRRLTTTQLTVLDHQPGDDPDHLYGAAFVDDLGRGPDVPQPVIPIGDIAHIHIS